MASGESTVDIQLLRKTAEALNPAIKNLSTLFSEWQNTVNSARGEWQGASSDNIKNTANQLKKSSDDLLKSMQSWQATLNNLAGIYTQAEKESEDKSRTLKFSAKSIQ